MTRVRLYPQAEQAIQQIYRYSRKEWGKIRAARYIAGLRSHFESLSEREELGLSRPWKSGSSIFKSRYERHLVFYLHSGIYIDVCLLVHGSQDFARQVESFEGTH